ncbi:MULTISPECIES: BON domain-containing protein [Burkholderia]|uniref:BON domain-containing protein n=1 Tax=Burkholderia TaxID=32008 RepID=UPI000688CEBC|nr:MULTISPECIES: BON domain-containing protein [Burkholderia]
MKNLARAIPLLALISACVAGSAQAGTHPTASNGSEVDPPSSDAVQQSTPDAAADKQRKAEDRLLARRVRAALARAKGLNATRIIVRVRDGIATLQGSVADTTQAGLALEATRRIRGVTAVQNQLRITGQLL